MKSLDPGRLRHRIKITELKRVQNETTLEISESWETYAEVWADIAPSSGREFIAAQAVASKVTGRMTIRYRDDITSEMRIVYRGKTYNIEAALPDMESGIEWLTLLVSEGVER